MDEILKPVSAAEFTAHKPETGFDHLSVDERNDLLINGGPQAEDYLNKLRDDGWFSGRWSRAAAMILPTGELIPVGELKHDATAKRALIEMNIKTELGDPYSLKFADKGGLSLGNFDVTGKNDFSTKDPRVKTAARYFASISPDESITVNTDHGEYKYSLKRLAEVDFDTNQIEPDEKIEYGTD